MEFDLSSLIILIVALSAFFIPITIDQLSKKSKKKTMKLLTQSAEENKLELSNIEIFQNENAIGIDKALKKIISINNNGSGVIKNIHSLNEFSKCSISEQKEENSESKFKSHTILKLFPKNKESEVVEFKIYKTKTNLASTEEEVAAKQLVKVISKLI